MSETPKRTIWLECGGCSRTRKLTSRAGSSAATWANKAEYTGWAITGDPLATERVAGTCAAHRNLASADEGTAPQRDLGLRCFCNICNKALGRALRREEDAPKV